MRHRDFVPADGHGRRVSVYDFEEMVVLMPDVTSVGSGLGRRRTLILGVVAVAQLM